MKPTLELVSELRDLEALRPAWEDLAARSATSEPMLQPFWLLPWWRVFGASGGRRLRVLAMREGPRLVGLAPLLARTHWYRPGLPFRRLELLGSGEAQEDEICSEYIGVLAERGAEAKVARWLASALRSGRLGEWDELLMPDMAGDEPLLSALVSELSRTDLHIEVTTTSLAPYITLPTSFEAYLASLPSSRRYVVSRSLRDLEAWAGVEIALERAETREELAQGRALLESLHGERWRARGQDGVFGSRRFRAFHDEVIPALFERDAIDLLWLRARGEPLAALYNIVWQGKTYFYQSGRRLDLPKPIRPGIAIHALAIRRAIELGQREYDFLAGSSQYKTQLAFESRPLVKLRAVKSSWREQARLTLVGARKRLLTVRDKALERAESFRKLG